MEWELQPLPAPLDKDDHLARYEHNMFFLTTSVLSSEKLPFEFFIFGGKCKEQKQVTNDIIGFYKSNSNTWKYERIQVKAAQNSSSSMASAKRTSIDSTISSTITSSAKVEKKRKFSLRKNLKNLSQNIKNATHKVFEAGKKTANTDDIDADEQDMFFPSHRFGSSCVVYTCPEENGVIEEKVVIFGGFDEFETPLNDVWVLIVNKDCKLWRWKRIDFSEEDKLPIGRREHSAVLLNDQMYIIGGVHGKKSLSDFWKLDLETMTWEELDKNLPFGSRHGHSAVLIEGNSVSATKEGSFGSASESTTALTPRKSNAIKKLVVLCGFSDHGMQIGNGLGIANNITKGVTLGLVQSINIPFTDKNIIQNYYNDIWMYDFTSKKWDRIDASGKAPEPRYSQTAAYVGKGVIFLYGGFQTMNTLKSAHVLDICEKRWVKVPRLKSVSKDKWPQARRGHTMIYNSSNKKIYVLGGKSIKKGVIGDVGTLDCSILHRVCNVGSDEFSFKVNKKNIITETIQNTVEFNYNDDTRSKNERYASVVAKETQRLDKDSTNIESLLKRAEAYIGLHLYEKAMNDIDTGLKLDSNLQLQTQKAYLLFKLSKYREALHLANKVTIEIDMSAQKKSTKLTKSQLKEEDALEYLLLNCLKVRLKTNFCLRNYDRCVQDCDRIYGKILTVKDKAIPNDKLQFIVAAQVYKPKALMMAKRFTEAKDAQQKSKQFLESQLSHITKFDPLHLVHLIDSLPGIHLKVIDTKDMLSSKLQRLKDFELKIEKAIKQNEEALKLNEESNKYRVEANYNKAAELLAAALVLDPWNVSWMYELALINISSRRFDTAVKLLKTCIELNSEEKKYYTTLILAYADKYNFAEAFALLDEARDLFDDEEEGQAVDQFSQIQNQITDRQKRYEEAESFISKGSELLLEDALEEALAAYESAISLEPNSPSALCGRARVFYKMHQNAEALRDARKALELAPLDVSIYSLTTNILMDTQQALEAEDLLKQAIAMIQIVSMEDSKKLIPLLEKAKELSSRQKKALLLYNAALESAIEIDVSLVASASSLDVDTSADELPSETVKQYKRITNLLEQSEKYCALEQSFLLRCKVNFKLKRYLKVITAAQKRTSAIDINDEFELEVLNIKCYCCLADFAHGLTIIQQLLASKQRWEDFQIEYLQDLKKQMEGWKQEHAKFDKILQSAKKHFDEKQFDKALPLFSKCLKDFENSIVLRNQSNLIQLYFLRAECYYHLKQYSESLSNVQVALQLRVEFPHVNILKLKNWIQMNQLQDALQHCTQVLNSSTPYNSPLNRIWVKIKLSLSQDASNKLFEVAKKALAENQLEFALSSVSQSISILPSSEKHLFRAQLYIQLKQQVLALKDFEITIPKLNKDNNKFVEYGQLYAKALMHCKKYSQAVAILRQITSVQPKNQQLLSLLNECLQLEESISQAMAYIQEADALLNSSADKEILDEKRILHKAMELYTFAINSNVEHVDAYLKRARVRVLLQKYAKALEDAKKALKWDPSIVEGYIIKTTCHIEDNQLDKALKCVQMGLELESENSELLELQETIQQRKQQLDSLERKNQVVQQLLKEEKFYKAKSLLQHMVSSCPFAPVSYFITMLQVVNQQINEKLIDKEQIENDLALAQHCIEKYSQNAQLHIQLSQLYWRGFGDAVNALHHYVHAMECDTNFSTSSNVELLQQLLNHQWQQISVDWNHDLPSNKELVDMMEHTTLLDDYKKGDANESEIISMEELLGNDSPIVSLESTMQQVPLAKQAKQFHETIRKDSSNTNTLASLLNVTQLFVHGFEQLGMQWLQQQRKDALQFLICCSIAAELPLPFSTQQLQQYFFVTDSIDRSVSKVECKAQVISQRLAVAKQSCHIIYTKDSFGAHEELYENWRQSEIMKCEGLLKNTVNMNVTKETSRTVMNHIIHWINCLITIPCQKGEKLLDKESIITLLQQLCEFCGMGTILLHLWIAERLVKQISSKSTEGIINVVSSMNLLWQQLCIQRKQLFLTNRECQLFEPIINQVKSWCEYNLLHQYLLLDAPVVLSMTLQCHLLCRMSELALYQLNNTNQLTVLQSYSMNQLWTLQFEQSLSQLLQLVKIKCFHPFDVSRFEEYIKILQSLSADQLKPVLSQLFPHSLQIHQLIYQTMTQLLKQDLICLLQTPQPQLQQIPVSIFSIPTLVESIIYPWIDEQLTNDTIPSDVKQWLPMDQVMELVYPWIIQWIQQMETNSCQMIKNSFSLQSFEKVIENRYTTLIVDTFTILQQGITFFNEHFMNQKWNRKQSEGISIHGWYWIQACTQQLTQLNVDKCKQVLSMSMTDDNCLRQYLICCNMLSIAIEKMDTLSWVEECTICQEIKQTTKSDVLHALTDCLEQLSHQLFKTRLALPLKQVVLLKDLTKENMVNDLDQILSSQIVKQVYKSTIFIPVLENLFLESLYCIMEWFGSNSSQVSEQTCQIIASDILPLLQNYFTAHGQGIQVEKFDTQLQQVQFLCDMYFAPTYVLIEKYNRCKDAIAPSVTGEVKQMTTELQITYWRQQQLYERIVFRISKSNDATAKSFVEMEKSSNETFTKQMQIQIQLMNDMIKDAKQQVNQFQSEVSLMELEIQQLQLTVQQTRQMNQLNRQRKLMRQQNIQLKQKLHDLKIESMIQKDRYNSCHQYFKQEVSILKSLLLDEQVSLKDALQHAVVKQFEQQYSSTMNLIAAFPCLYKLKQGFLCYLDAKEGDQKEQLNRFVWIPNTQQENTYLECFYEKEEWNGFFLEMPVIGIIEIKAKRFGELNEDSITFILEEQEEVEEELEEEKQTNKEEFEETDDEDQPQETSAESTPRKLVKTQKQVRFLLFEQFDKVFAQIDEYIQVIHTVDENSSSFEFGSSNLVVEAAKKAKKYASKVLKLSKHLNIFTKQHQQPQISKALLTNNAKLQGYPISDALRTKFAIKAPYVRVLKRISSCIEMQNKTLGDLYVLSNAICFDPALPVETAVEFRSYIHFTDLMKVSKQVSTENNTNVIKFSDFSGKTYVYGEWREDRQAVFEIIKDALSAYSLSKGDSIDIQMKNNNNVMILVPKSKDGNSSVANKALKLIPHFGLDKLLIKDKKEDSEEKGNATGTVNEVSTPKQRNKFNIPPLFKNSNK